MIRWCAYCQTFDGQSPPFNNFSFTHGICKACAITVKEGRKSIVKKPDVESFFKALFESVECGILVEPKALIAKSRSLELPVPDLFLGVLHPLLQRIGLYFEEGKMSYEKEHLFSDTVLSILNELPKVEVSDRCPVALLSPPDNRHSIRPEFLKRLLISEKGLHAEIIANAPTTSQEYLKVFLERQPKIVGVSIALPTQANYIDDLLRWRGDHKNKLGAPAVFIGGPASESLKNHHFAKEHGVYVSELADVKFTLDQIAQICTETAT